MKWIKDSRDVYVVVNVFPDPEPSFFAASDEVFDIERFWNGTWWCQNERDALTWESYETAKAVVRAILKTETVEGRVCVYKASVETTIEVYGEISE